MINPWLSLSLRTARLGLEAQNAVIDSLFRMAGTGRSNNSTSIAAPEPITQAVPEEIAQVGTSEHIVDLEDNLSNRDVPAEGRASVAPSAMKVHKRTLRKGRKHR
jgi:hypothetical protein